MTDQPTNLADYTTRFEANTRVTGFGAGVVTHLPCPWCAAPDFQLLRITSVHDDMQRDTTCRVCGRSGHSVFHINEPGHTEFEFVQTGGDDPPPWLNPPPRRVP